MEKARKLYILVRHGERADEVEQNTQIADPLLTQKGVTDSTLTGKEIGKKLYDLGSIGQNELKIAFMSSVTYRCLQTLRAVKDGIKEYIKEISQPSSMQQEDAKTNINCDSVLASIDKATTFVEEACTEKSAKQEKDFYTQMQYIANRPELQKQFSDLNLVFQSLFDYKDKDFRYCIDKHISHHGQVIKLLEQFHSRMINRLINDPVNDVYLVLTHGQFLNKLISYMQMKGEGPPKVDYNSVVFLELDLSKGKKHFCHLNAFEPIVHWKNERIISSTGTFIDKAALKAKLRNEKETKLDGDKTKDDNVNQEPIQNSKEVSKSLVENLPEPVAKQPPQVSEPKKQQPPVQTPEPEKPISTSEKSTQQKPKPADQPKAKPKQNKPAARKPLNSYD